MFYEIEEAVSDIVNVYIDDNCLIGSPGKTGLDIRAFTERFYYNNDCIIVTEAANRSLRYYGGFEYIDSEYVRQYGDYVFYSAEADRVRDVIDNLTENENANV